MREATIAKTLAAPTNFIVHSLTDLNNQLYKGRPFFIDIVQQGVALYEAVGFLLSTPGKLSAEETLAEAQKHFDTWFPKVASAVRGASRYLEGDEPNDAAFTLHQAVERAYHCLLLTFALYSQLCRARHNGLYAERRTMQMARVLRPSVGRLGELCAA